MSQHFGSPSHLIYVYPAFSPSEPELDPVIASKLEVAALPPTPLTAASEHATHSSWGRTITHDVRFLLRRSSPGALTYMPLDRDLRCCCEIHIKTADKVTRCPRRSSCQPARADVRPRVFRRASQGPRRPCSTPPRGCKARPDRPLRTAVSQQRRPGRPTDRVPVPGFTGAYYHRQYTAPLCLGVRGPASRYCVAC